MTNQLEHEINEQPAATRRLLDRVADDLPAVLHDLPLFDTIVLAARGSSRHAGVYAQYALGALTGIPVGFAPPSLHTLYRATPRWGRALLVVITQGGGSPDLLDVVRTARRVGRPSIAVTNTADSPIAAAVDHVIDVHAGPERSLAATKSYTAQLTALAALAAVINGSSQLGAELERVPDHLAEQLALHDDAIAELASASGDDTRWTILARGYNLATALEGALKLTELTYGHATGWSAAEYLHGPIAAADRRTRAVVIDADDPAVRDTVQSTAAAVAARGADLTTISTTGLPGARRLRLAPHVPAWLSPICAVVPLQRLALAITEARGQDPDRPRGLTKIVETT